MGALGLHVELQPAPRARRRGDLLQRLAGERAEHQPCVQRGGRGGGAAFTVGMRQPLVGDGRDEDRMREGFAE